MSDSFVDLNWLRAINFSTDDNNFNYCIVLWRVGATLYVVLWKIAIKRSIAGKQTLIPDALLCRPSLAVSRKKYLSDTV